MTKRRKAKTTEAANAQLEVEDRVLSSTGKTKEKLFDLAEEENTITLHCSTNVKLSKSTHKYLILKKD